MNPFESLVTIRRCNKFTRWTHWDFKDLSEVEQVPVGLFRGDVISADLGCPNCLNFIDQEMNRLLRKDKNMSLSQKHRCHLKPQILSR